MEGPTSDNVEEHHDSVAEATATTTVVANDNAEEEDRDDAMTAVSESTTVSAYQWTPTATAQEVLANIDLSDVLYYGKNKNWLHQSKRTIVAECKNKNFILFVFLPSLVYDEEKMKKQLAPVQSVMNTLGEMHCGRGMQVFLGKALDHPFIARIMAGRLVHATSVEKKPYIANIANYTPAFAMERRKQRLSERPSSRDLELKNCLFCIVVAISHMHRHGCIHGQVSPENVMVNAKLERPLLTGLEHAQIGRTIAPEMARYAHDDGDGIWDPPECQFYGPLGTKGRVLTTNTAAATEAVDVWNLGMLMYRTAFPKCVPPFLTGEEYKRYRRYAEILKNPSTKADEMSKYQQKMELFLSTVYSEVATSLEQRINENMPANVGFSADKADGNGWYQMIRKCLRPNPADRPSIFQVLADPFWNEVTIDVTNLTSNMQQPNDLTVISTVPRNIEQVRPVLQDLGFSTNSKVNGVMGILKRLSRHYAQDGLHSDSAEGRVALAAYLAAQFFTHSTLIEGKYATWTGIQTPEKRYLAFLRAACRLMFDTHQLGRDRFMRTDRRVWENFLINPPEFYQILYDVEVLMLVMLANDFRGIA